MSNSEGTFRYAQHTNQDELRIAGPMIPAAWAPLMVRTPESQNPTLSNVQPVDGVMLIDTGAAGVAIDEDVAAALGLTPSGQSQELHGIGGRAQGAHCEATLLLYLTDMETQVKGWYGFYSRPLIVPGLQQFHAEGGHIMPDGSPMRVLGLMGRSFLQCTTFTYNGVTGQFELLVDKKALTG